MAYARIGELDQATAECELATQANPLSPYAFTSLADAIRAKLHAGSWPTPLHPSGIQPRSQSPLHSPLIWCVCLEWEKRTHRLGGSEHLTYRDKILEGMGESSVNEFDDGLGTSAAQVLAQADEIVKSQPAPSTEDQVMSDWDVLEWDRVCDAYETALSLDASSLSSEHFLFLALARMQRDDSSAALPVLRTLVRKEPSSFHARLIYALTLDRLTPSPKKETLQVRMDVLGGW